MRNFGVFILLVCSLSELTWASETSSRANLREGLWRIDIEMILPGRGPQTNGPMFREMCLTNSNLAQMLIPDGAPCQGGITSQKPSGMDFKMSCQQGQTVVYSKGHIEFAKEKLAGAVLTIAPGYSMEFKTLISGKYLGNCPPGSKAAINPQPKEPRTGGWPQAVKPLVPLPSYKP